MLAGLSTESKFRISIPTEVKARDAVAILLIDRQYSRAWLHATYGHEQIQ
jgi:hypothetical protein